MTKTTRGKSSKGSKVKNNQAPAAAPSVFGGYAVMTNDPAQQSPAPWLSPSTVHFPKKSPESVWIQRFNPLYGLSVDSAQLIFDAARSGAYSMLQYLYSQLEITNPTLAVCVERRSAALAGLARRVVADDDSDDAEFQAAWLADKIKQLNLTDLLEHLDLAFFRGFSHAAPIWDDDDLVGFDLLDSWNFSQDILTGAWYWNPSARNAVAGSPGTELIPDGELITVQRRICIDYPAMAISIRLAVGDRQWGEFLERYGVPFCVLVAPPMANEAQIQEFAQSAAKIADGRATALPNGSSYGFAESARGVNPFSEFLDYNMRLIVLMATGGTLTSLAEAGSGTLAGGAQMKVWEQIVSRDAVVVSEELNSQLFRPMLRRKFGRALAKFEMMAEERQSASDLMDIAVKARAAGFILDKDELERKTGFKLGVLPTGGEDNAWNPEMYKAAEDVMLPKARTGVPDGETRPVRTANAKPNRGIAIAMAADLQPLAKKIQEAYNLPTVDEMRSAIMQLVQELPDMIPEDPVLAQEIADVMTSDFLKGYKLESAKARMTE